MAPQVLADSSSLSIDIRPGGSTVELEGPQHTITATPNTISRPVAGWYRLRASYPGYESWSKKVYIDASSPSMISGALSQKSRFRAGVRSIFFPGWGHYYSDRKGRGALITAVSVALFGGYLYLDNRADNKVSDYEVIRDDFNEAETVAEQEALKPQVESARRRAFDAESDRRNWGWATIAFYGYQVLDAVVFFPEPPHVGVSGLQLGVQVPSPDAVLLGATYEF
jgi:hypothetical protein